MILLPGTGRKHKDEPGIVEMGMIENFLYTRLGEIPRVSKQLSAADRIGSWKARWCVGRMSYRIDPGIYAAGDPDDISPVLVTSNYKMSFDRLRSSLKYVDCWILVLDTGGINVWCSAAKGDFGNEEIIRRVFNTGIANLVSHRTLILPQLSAPGVISHKLEADCGFRPLYGPVRAEDIPSFLAKGRRADDDMRRVTFETWDRLVLVPVEIVTSMKLFIPLAIAILLLSGLYPGGYFPGRMMKEGLISLSLFSAAFLGGALITPLLLPYLPGRAFSLKGGCVGVVMASLWAIFFMALSLPFVNRLSSAGWCLLIPSISSFMAMNFTGSSTFTSLSGVKREIKLSIPVQIILMVSGMALWIGGRYL